MVGWGGYMGPQHSAPKDEPPPSVSPPVVRDHETLLMTRVKVNAMPRRLRGNLILLQWMYKNQPEKFK